MPTTDRIESLKAYLVLADEMSVANGGVKVDEVSSALGHTREQGRAVAQHLEGIGWVKVQWSQMNSEVRLWLTYDGLEMIAKWNQPRWRQWIDAHPLTRDAIMMTGTGIIAGIIVAWLVTE